MTQAAFFSSSLQQELWPGCRACFLQWPSEFSLSPTCLDIQMLSAVPFLLTLSKIDPYASIRGSRL